MSRNLCQEDCAFCGGKVAAEEAARPITPEEAGPHFDDYEGCLFANARCLQCEAPYLAWIDDGPTMARYRLPSRAREDGSHFDLSHRNAFNDEPASDGSDDPKWRITWVAQKTPWK